MSQLSILFHLRRAFAFGRHIPPAKLFRRLQLSLYRKWNDRTGWNLGETGAVPAMADAVLLPLFLPRSGMITAEGGQFAFRFLGRVHKMSGAIDWAAPGQGAEFQLWRMNLHYMEYLEETDTSAFAFLVLDWISANQPIRQGMWRDSWNACALSLRVVVWMQQIARRRASLPAAALATMLASLAAQLRFLENNLETDIGGNHLIKNIKALLWASTFFTGAEAERWRRLGLEWLGVALREQILPDGMHFERSPSYHTQVLADLLECHYALLGSVPPPGLSEALQKMAQAIADLSHPDGLVAQFNDSGLHMGYAPDACLQAFEVLFHVRPQPRPVFALQSSGYFGLRSGNTYFVADCGRIAPDDLPAHGHGDILSFEWSAGGHRIVVDQGVFEYIPGEPRRMSRSAACHNTLCFDGADQAQFYGAFRCGRRPDVFVTMWEPQATCLILEGWHNGFANLPGAPVHRRRFEIGPDNITIVDQIEGRPEMAARISILFHPDVDVQICGAGLRLSAGTTVVTLQATSSVILEDAVWWPDMGAEQRTRRASIPVACHVREVITVLRVEKPASAGIQEVS